MYEKIEVGSSKSLSYRYTAICFVILVINLIVSFGDQITADEIELVLGDKNIIATGFKDASSISAFREEPRNIPVISIPNSILQSFIYLNKSYVVIRFMGFVKLFLVCLLIMELVKDKRLALLFVLFISFGANHFRILVNRPELDILLSVVFFVYLQSGERHLLGFELIPNEKILIILYLMNVTYLVSAHPKSIFYYPVIFIVLPRIFKSNLNRLLIGILILVVVGYSWNEKVTNIEEVGILKNIADSYFIGIVKSKGALAPKIKAIRINIFNQDAKLDSLELSNSPFSPMSKYNDKANNAFFEIYNLNVNIIYFFILCLSLFALLTFENNYIEKLIIAGTLTFAALLANKNYYNTSHILFMLSAATVLWLGRSNKYNELIRSLSILLLILWSFNSVINYYLKSGDLDYSFNKFNLTSSTNCQVDKSDGVVFYDNLTFSYLPWRSRASNVAYLDYLNINDPNYYKDKFKFALLKDCENSRLNAFDFIEKAKQENGFCCYKYKEK